MDKCKGITTLEISFRIAGMKFGLGSKGCLFCRRWDGGPLGTELHLPSNCFSPSAAKAVMYAASPGRVLTIVTARNAIRYVNSPLQFAYQL